jgi:hypothetical protein
VLSPPYAKSVLHRNRRHEKMAETLPPKRRNVHQKSGHCSIRQRPAGCLMSEWYLDCKILVWERPGAMYNVFCSRMPGIEINACCCRNSACPILIKGDVVRWI